MKNKNEITGLDAIMCFGVIVVIVGACLYTIFHKFNTAQEYSNMAGITALLLSPFVIYSFVKSRPKKKSENYTVNVQSNVSEVQEQPNVSELQEHANYKFNNGIAELGELSKIFVEEITQARRNNNVWNWQHSVYEYLSNQETEIICKLVGCWVRDTDDGRGTLFYVNQNHERWRSW